MPMLKEKKIVVAGGGGRIGWEIVKDIIKHGGEVIALDTNYRDSVSKEIESDLALQNNVQLMKLDVCSAVEVKRFFNSVTSIDGFVNCSYPRGNNYGADFLDVDVSDFNSTLSLHLGSAVLLSQECVRYFNQEPRWFSLVNFSSIYGVVAPRFNIYEGTKMTTPVEYALMKAAIQQLNKYVSAYVRDSKFRINTVAPGGILDGQPDSFLERYKCYTRGTGMLDSSDMLGSVMFLLSDHSRYLTASNIVIDDGFTL